MYGTIARIRIKPGMEGAIIEALREREGQIPGYRAGHLYRMDVEPGHYFLTIIFESKEAYDTNARSPEQHANYLHLREMMADDPAWHDGEIVYGTP